MFLAASDPSATSNDAAVFVALLSIANCGGRLIVGTLAQLYQHKLSRPFFMTVTTAFMALGTLISAFASTQSLLYLACIVVGLSFGSYWAIIPTTMSDLFGQSNLGANYNFLSFATSISTYIFCVELAGTVYDSHIGSSNNNITTTAAPSGNHTMFSLPYAYAPHIHPHDTLFLPSASLAASDSERCYGRDCFFLTYIVLTAVCVGGVVLSAILTVRTWRGYMQTYSKRA